MSTTNHIRVARGDCRDCGQLPGRPYRCWLCKWEHTKRENLRRWKIRLKREAA